MDTPIVTNEIEVKNGFTNEGDGIIELKLKISEPTVVKYLSSIDELIREEKAIEALRVGIIAIQSASPSLDTKIVEEKFREVEKSINDYITTFQGDLKTQLETYFKSGTGEVPISLDKLLGETGVLSGVFKKYFNVDTGLLQKLIQDQVGPSSPFAKNLDPNNKESVISKLEDFVELQLETTTGEIIKEFSLDKEDSALSKLKKSLSEEVREIQETNTKFFIELKKELGFKEGKETEAEKGTEKGREFEAALYEPIAVMARQLGDSSENVRGVVGKIERRKVGDYVLTLGNTTGAPNINIVIEAKNESGYTLKRAIEELKLAKENREADAGIFVFAKGCEPPEVGDFINSGMTFSLQ